MLILLPPSEGKAPPRRGRRLEPSSLFRADLLGERRTALLDALERLGRAPLPEAVGALGISDGQAGEVEVDAGLRRAPTAAARKVYSGVLYDRLELPGLAGAAARRASGHVLIASALWGFLRPRDRIPYYRFSIKARLDGIGALPGFWRPVLREAMPDRDGEVIVDMRSSSYATAWKPRSARLLPVRAFTGSGGERKVVSHMAKAVRGDVARALLTAERLPESVDQIAACVAAAGHRVELTATGLDVITPAPPA